MRGIVSAFGLAALLVLRFAPPGSEQKTEAGLIGVWEQEQKSDPTTIQFEKTKDRQYHFATKRFPFDGELLIRNVVLEDYPGINRSHPQADDLAFAPQPWMVWHPPPHFWRAVLRSLEK